MKPILIAYEQLWPTGQFSNQRLRAEIQLDDTDNPQEAFTLAKKIVNDAFEKLNPGIVWEEKEPYERFEADGYNPGAKPHRGYENINEKAPADKIQSFINTIQLCNTTANLERFRATVEREKNEALTMAFQNKLQSLQNQ
jgi:hypothetical protein